MLASFYLHDSFFVTVKLGLVKDVSLWGQPYRIGRQNVDEQFPSHRMVDDFRLFNGIPGIDRVASKIEKILVPTEWLKHKVEAFLNKNSEMFGDEKPTVEMSSVP